MSRGGHNTKNKQQKDFYSRYIKEQNYEPTVDESLPFNTSDEKNEDFSLQQANRKRKEPAKDIVLRHFEENWVKWLFSLGGVALFYFFVTFQINLAKTDAKSIENEKDITQLDSKYEKKVESIDKDLEKLDSKLDGEKDKNQEQDLKIQKNSILIESTKTHKTKN